MPRPGIGGGYTQAILDADLGVVNAIEVIAIDGAGNRSAPATVTVDTSQGLVPVGAPAVSPTRNPSGRG
jgi:hypothetical protein